MDGKRQQARLDYVRRSGYFVAGGTSRNSFSQLPLDRMSTWPLGIHAREEFYSRKGGILTMAATKPSKATLRTYNVGFGDSFLLTFHYSDRDRHV